jgi:hypothetical protein
MEGVGAKQEQDTITMSICTGACTFQHTEEKSLHVQEDSLLDATAVALPASACSAAYDLLVPASAPLQAC